MALYFAQSLFCEAPREPWCLPNLSECLRVANRNHPDIHFLEPEGASIKIEQIRDLQNELSLPRSRDKYKVYILNQAEKLTAQAANSLLKLLEDPYPGTIAILINRTAHHTITNLIISPAANHL